MQILKGSSVKLIPGWSSSTHHGVDIVKSLVSTVHEPRECKGSSYTSIHACLTDPILDEVAPKLGDVMRIGKVDSTVQKRISSEYAIQAYPTLKVFRKDQPTLDFEGPRTAEAFIEFAKRLSGRRDNTPAPPTPFFFSFSCPLTSFCCLPLLSLYV